MSSSAVASNLVIRGPSIVSGVVGKKGYVKPPAVIKDSDKDAIPAARTPFRGLPVIRKSFHLTATWKTEVIGYTKLI